MIETWHVCYGAGAVDLGFSRFAANVLSVRDGLPSRTERELIADHLLEEVIRDGTMENIWGHAGLLAIAADNPEVVDSLFQDWP